METCFGCKHLNTINQGIVQFYICTKLKPHETHGRKNVDNAPDVDPIRCDQFEEGEYVWVEFPSKPSIIEDCEV